MRQIVDDIEPRDVLKTEQVDGLGLLLAENRDEHVAGQDLLLAALLHVENRALQYALEAERRLHVDVLVVVQAQARCGVGDELLQLAAEPADVGAAILQNLYDLGRIEQREQQVLHGDEFVVLLAGLLKGLVQTVFELAG